MCKNLLYLDLNGNSIKKTPETNPYNYDSYVQWMKDYNREKSKTVYSDRMYSWDYKKFNECCEKIWGNTGQFFNDRKAKDINKFLNLYFEKEVKLTVILNCCNQSNGFPYWCFIYEE